MVSDIKDRLDRDPQRIVTLLEVGAGTLGLTQFLLDYLHPYRQHIRFWVTDKSPSLVHRASEILNDQAWITCTCFDLDDSSSFSDLPKMDIVISSNGLHTSENALRSVHSVMKTNGVLLFHETIRYRPFFELIFGLFRHEGFQLFSLETWRDRLERMGWDSLKMIQDVSGDQALFFATASETVQLNREPQSFKVAIIGMSCRVAGFDDLEAFKIGLLKGNPSEKERYLSPEFPAFKGGFLSQRGEADSAFFDIPSVEAAGMDETQWQFLEESWLALKIGRAHV